MKKIVLKQNINISIVNRANIYTEIMEVLQVVKRIIKYKNEPVISADIYNYLKKYKVNNKVEKFEVSKNFYLNSYLQMVWPGPFCITGWIRKTRKNCFCP
jgi:nicotinic acid phosphoribosyltransferase